ncbi:hypothetical protein E5D57_002335 [Metarhizium anisopliae]|nr:hypothetical protein E5D57_002335 [Metarhizium anisopliae]
MGRILFSPECVRVGGAITIGRSPSSRRCSRVFTRTTQGASRSETSATVTTGSKHRGWTKGDVLARGSASRALETSEVVHANLVAGLLHIAARKVASVTTAHGRATRTATRVGSSGLLGLGSLGFGFGTHFIESLGALVGFLGDPVGPTQIKNIHKHKLHSALQLRKLSHVLNALEVSVHHGTALFGGIQIGTNGAQQLAEGLNFGLIRDTLIVDKFVNTFVHDTLSQHAELVQLTDELDETKTTSLGGGSFVLNDLTESAAIRLILGLPGNREDLVGDSVKVLRGHLVEGGLDLSLHQFRVKVTAGIGSRSRRRRLVANTGRLPTAGSDGNRFDLLTSG